MYNYLPGKDEELGAWITNFLSVAGTNLAALGLTTTDLAALATDSDNFTVDLANVVATKNAAKAVVAQKDADKKTMEHDARVLVKRIQAHPGVSTSLKKHLGINTDDGTRTSKPPVAVKDVTADAQSTGVNTILWNKNGNLPTTQFVVEAKKPTDSGWTIVGQTTKAKFDHTGQTPGVALNYRVVAARADKASLPSVVVTVYGG